MGLAETGETAPEGNTMSLCSIPISQHTDCSSDRSEFWICPLKALAREWCRIRVPTTGITGWRREIDRGQRDNAGKVISQGHAEH